MTKAVKFEFFEIGPYNPELAEVLENNLIDNCTSLTHRSHKLRLENYRVTEEGYHIGTAVHINTISLPPKVHSELPGLSTLGLADKEGVGSLTSFLIDPARHLLVLQRNNNGIRQGSFVHLVDSLTGLDIELKTLVTKDTLQKLNGFNYVSQIIIGIAQPQSAAAYDNTTYKKAGELAEEYYAEGITMVLKLGRRPKPNDVIGAIKAKVKGIPRSDEKLERLIVKGKNFDDEKTAPLDLLKDRLVVELDVPLEDRELKVHHLESAVLQAFQSKQDELELYTVY